MQSSGDNVRQVPCVDARDLDRLVASTYALEERAKFTGGVTSD
jgi:hypothetical protein